VLITDQGSYSDVVFGILTLLGFDYRPGLADLPGAKLWRIEPSADYGALDRAASGRIDLDKIRRHWPDILRVVASVHTGEISAHDVIRVLQRDGRPTQLGETIAHYGRIFKTLHVLTFVDDPAYRRQLNAMRNLQEGRHGLGRHIFHGRRGDLYRAYHAGMEDQLGAPNAVAPKLVAAHGIGSDTAPGMLLAAGDNPDRLGSERSWAALLASNPIEASAGKTARHRLNRGGDRHGNSALWRIVVRMASDPRTKAYVERRTKEGLSTAEIIRCLKRYVARETFDLLPRELLG
jgi:hypothetical protein